VDQGEVIGLGEVEVRVVQALHRAGVVEERVLALVVVLEGPPIGQVGLRVTVVVDVDVVTGIGGELVEVRAARRVLERQPVRHQRGSVRLSGLTKAYTSVLSYCGCRR